MRDDTHPTPDGDTDQTQGGSRGAADRTLDAGDVVEGPVGSASLKDPTGKPMGADLNELGPIEASDRQEDAS